MDREAPKAAATLVARRVYYGSKAAATALTAALSAKGQKQRFIGTDIA
jgi:hypothetical protein